jgi:hypothetical protein
MNNSPNYATYSKEQLEGVLLRIDKERFPERVTEIEQRLKDGNHRRDPQVRTQGEKELSLDLLVAERVGAASILFIIAYFILNLFFQFGTDDYVIDLIPFIAGATLIKIKKDTILTMASSRFLAHAFVAASLIFTAINFSFIQPWDLSATQFKLFPRDSFGYLAFFTLKITLFVWAGRTLATTEVLKFEQSSKWFRTVLRHPIPIGLLAALLFGWITYSKVNGEVAQQGVAKARIEYGTQFNYTATAVKTKQKLVGPTHSVAVTAWNQEKIMFIEEHWTEKETAQAN